MSTLKSYALFSTSTSIVYIVKTNMFSLINIVLEPSSNMSEACRTCLRLINIDKSPFYEIEADDMQVSEESCRYKLLSIVPEMALNITPKSMLCGECHWSLQAFFEFKKKCLKTENIIARYFQINLDLDSKNLDLKEVSAFNAADIKIYENKFVEVFVKEEVELSDTVIVKHEVDNLSLESAEEARLKNQDLGSLADTRFTEDEAPIEEDCGLPEKSDPTTQERIHTDERLYICSVCGKGYPSNSKLVIHMRNHTGEKPYRCEICDSQFTAKNHLTYHLRAHTGEKPYRCETCNRSFTHKWNFKTHLRVHTGERPHVCTVCGKGFAQNNKLTTHMRTHTNEKPYLCEICNRRFLEKYNLTAHLRTHTGEWPYVCGVCGKGFSINSKLLVHMRSHTGEKPYGCKICDQQFTIKQDLNVHLRKHTGERPYRCEKCDRGFTRKSLLTNHLRIHSGELPYFCTICGQGYSSSFNLKEHTCTNDKEQPDQYNKNSNPVSTRTVSSANTAKSSSGAAAHIEVHYENS